MKNKNADHIFITWFPMYHGIAYIKHILASFYDGTVSPDTRIDATGLIQEQKEMVFNNSSEGFMFDKVYILTPQDIVYKKITQKSSGWRKQEIYNNDEFFKKYNLVKIAQDICAKKLDIKREFEYVEKNYPDKLFIWTNLSWRNIQHYTPSEQKWWLLNKSNLPTEYKKRVSFIEIEDKELPNHFDYEKNTKVIYSKVSQIQNRHKNANFIINIGLANNQISVAWYILGNSGLLSNRIKFIESYDMKNSSPGKRFQKFFITERKVNLLSEITNKIKLFTYKPISKTEEIAKLKFETYLKQGFSILLLGERGVGKSHIVNYYADKQGKNLIAVNCASFIDSHIAESDLFGYKKGAFTDAKQDTQGLIEKADGGILFMDEIHTLPKDVQFKLMRAFATDQENRMTIRRLGETKERKIKLKALIFATNRTIEELKQVLLPDFFDRIAQLIIEMPPLRNNPKRIIPAFKEIWEQLRFDEFYSYEEFPAKDKELLEWIKTLPLYGNYRDLQRIAMNYKAYLDFPEKLKKLLSEKTPFKYTKKQFEVYMLKQAEPKNKYFDENKTPEQILKEFKRDLANWAIHRFSSAQKAVNHFDKLGQKITKETLYKWKAGGASK